VWYEITLYGLLIKKYVLYVIVIEECYYMTYIQRNVLYAIFIKECII